MSKINRDWAWEPGSGGLFCGGEAMSESTLGKELRDAGMAATIIGREEWFQKAFFHVVNRWTRGRRGIAEEWRLEIEARPDIGPPPKQHYRVAANVWGALTNSLAKQGIIKKTGVRLQMRTATSHARETDVWERT